MTTRPALSYTCQPFLYGLIFNHCHRQFGLSSPKNSVTVHLNMSERENGQLPLAKRTIRSRISSERWEQVKTAYASGIGLREIARNMGIPEGTVLARAKREGWTRQIRDAKALAKQKDMSAAAVTAMEAVVVTMQQRGQRHVERMAGVTEKVLPHLEGMESDEILLRVDQVEKLDKVARRTYGLNNDSGQSLGLRLNILNVNGDMFASDEEREAYMNAPKKPQDALTICEVTDNLREGAQ
jgi:uncharacterized protein YjcR